MLEVLFGDYLSEIPILREMNIFEMEIKPLLLANVKEEVFRREPTNCEFLIHPLTQFLNDIIIIQYGTCEVFSRKDWLEAVNRGAHSNNTATTTLNSVNPSLTNEMHLNQQLSNNETNANANANMTAKNTKTRSAIGSGVDLLFPDPLKIKKEYQMIGFREFITKQPLDFVVVPSVETEMVFILKISRKVWDEIMDECIGLNTNEYKQFIENIKNNVSHESMYIFIFFYFFVFCFLWF